MPTGLLHAPPASARGAGATSRRSTRTSGPGTYDQVERLADMDANHVEAAINFPNIFPRFAGQGFAERTDKELALACLRVYNDWMIDEWCGGAGRGRLIPLTLVPLWDARAGRRRGAPVRGQGQLRHRLHREPAPSWAARRSTAASGTRCGRPAGRRRHGGRMHIGSSSSMPTTSPDAPLATSMSLYAQNAQGSLCDWVFSGTLERFPQSEDRLRREPGRLDAVPAGAHGRGVAGRPRGRRGWHAPSEQVRGRVFGCVFDDLHGLKVRDDVGVEQSCSRRTTRTPTARSRTPARWPAISSWQPG